MKQEFNHIRKKEEWPSNGIKSFFSSINIKNHTRFSPLRSTNFSIDLPKLPFTHRLNIL